MLLREAVGIASRQPRQHLDGGDRRLGVEPAVDFAAVRVQPRRSFRDRLYAPVWPTVDGLLFAPPGRSLERGRHVDGDRRLGVDRAGSALIHPLPELGLGGADRGEGDHRIGARPEIGDAQGAGRVQPPARQRPVRRRRGRMPALGDPRADAGLLAELELGWNRFTCSRGAA
jgi:hypothetical protein